MNHRTRNRLIGALLVLLLLFCAQFALKRLIPLQLAELSSRVEIWWGNVHSVSSAGLEGYSRDLGCAARAQGQDCRCIALVHGAGDTAMTWKRVLLSSGRDWEAATRLYAWDLPGFGRSAAPANVSDYRARQLAARLRDALAGVKECERWMVVGNSFGGWVATWLALDWGRKVNKLVLVGSAGLKRKESAASLLAESSVATLKEFQRRAYHKPRELPDYIWEAAARRAKAGNSRELFAAQTGDDYLDTYLPQLRTPTLVFWGLSDQIIPPLEGRQLASMIPGAILREIKDCGHLPQKECLPALITALAEMSRSGAM